MIQGVVSLFIVMYGAIYIAGDFKEIRAVVDLENKSWETLRNLPSFQIFNHRGRSLSPEYIQPYWRNRIAACILSLHVDVKLWTKIHQFHETHEFYLIHKHCNFLILYKIVIKSLFSNTIDQIATKKNSLKNLRTKTHSLRFSSFFSNSGKSRWSVLLVNWKWTKSCVQLKKKNESICESKSLVKELWQISESNCVCVCSVCYQLKQPSCNRDFFDYVDRSPLILL